MRCMPGWKAKMRTWKVFATVLDERFSSRPLPDMLQILQMSTGLRKGADCHRRGRPGSGSCSPRLFLVRWCATRRLWVYTSHSSEGLLVAPENLTALSDCSSKLHLSSRCLRLPGCGREETKRGASGDWRSISFPESFCLLGLCVFHGPRSRQRRVGECFVSDRSPKYAALSSRESAAMPQPVSVVKGSRMHSFLAAPVSRGLEPGRAGRRTPGPCGFCVPLSQHPSSLTLSL